MIDNFRGLLNDKIRIEAFQKAINYLINHDKTVLEIGSALGTYSFFAAQNNARSIYAIEMDSIFHAGVEIARRNNLLDKINFINGKSTEISIPEKVDYIIMEDYSPFFIYEKLEDTIIDARNRFLKKGGKFIPNTIILKTSLVEAPTLYNQINLWKESKDVLYDINWDYTTELAFNRPYYADYHKLKPLTEESLIKSIDLSTDNNWPFMHKVSTKVIEDGTIHGVCGWWDTYFTKNQFLTNSPDKEYNTWDRCFFLSGILFK